MVWWLCSRRIDNNGFSSGMALTVQNQALLAQVVHNLYGILCNSLALRKLANDPRLDRHRERASFAAKLIRASPEQLLLISFYPNVTQMVSENPKDVAPKAATIPKRLLILIKFDQGSWHNHPLVMSLVEMGKIFAIHLRTLEPCKRHDNHHTAPASRTSRPQFQ